MNRTDLYSRLISLSTALPEAADKLGSAELQVFSQKATLEDIRAEAVLSGQINGRNEEIRSAQLRRFAVIQVDLLAKTEADLMAAKTAFRRLSLELDCLKSAVALLTGGSGG